MNSSGDDGDRDDASRPSTCASDADAVQAADVQIVDSIENRAAAKGAVEGGAEEDCGRTKHELVGKRDDGE